VEWRNLPCGAVISTAPMGPVSRAHGARKNAAWNDAAPLRFDPFDLRPNLVLVHSTKARTCTFD
jgi:hypothetical protein